MATALASASGFNAQVRARVESVISRLKGFWITIIAGRHLRRAGGAYSAKSFRFLLPSAPAMCQVCLLSLARMVGGVALGLIDRPQSSFAAIAEQMQRANRDFVKQARNPF